MTTLKDLPRLVLRHALAIALIGACLGAAGCYFTVRLVGNLRTDFEELLPATARSVLDLNEISRRLESIDNITVVVLSQDTRASRRFIDDLAASLRRLPRSQLSSVEYRISGELKFFRDRLPLYMDLKDLVRIRDYVRERLEYEREIRNPLNIFSGKELPEPKLDLNRIESGSTSKLSAYAQLPDGYYATPDEKVRALLAYMPGKSFSVDRSREFKRMVEKAILDLNPRSYAPDLEYRFTGGVEDAIEESDALVADLELSTALVTAFVALAMLLFYRDVLATAALVSSLFVGTLWTFGASYFAVGYLNANSAFMGSIVLGNGINFGIIFLARYLEERRAGSDAEGAAARAMSTTATATLTAALAAGLSYGALTLTSFRGFSQFGVIGLIGMTLCWVSSYALLPALLKLVDRRPASAVPKPPARRWVVNSIAGLVGRFPAAVFGLALALTAASLFAITRYDRDRVIESDLSRLRNKYSLTQGSEHVSEAYMDKIFHRYMSPLVVLAQSRGDAERIRARLLEAKRAEGAASPIASVQTIDEFLPGDQREKIAVLRQIRKLLPPPVLGRLDERQRRDVATLLNPAASVPIAEGMLPPLVLRKFTERSGAVGNLVLVEPPLDASTSEGSFMREFVEEVRRAADSVRPGTPVSGSLAVTYDMNRAITREGPRATLFAFLAVVALVALLFRRIRVVLLCLFALLLGSCWLVGFILGLGYKVNFLNFIALPITFGIGVDYGVNVFQRYLLEGRGSILSVIRNTGGAVLLASLTTIIGYSSLLIASNQGFVSFGTLAVVGEISCVSAAVIGLPALLMLWDRRQGNAR